MDAVRMTLILKDILEEYRAMAVEESELHIITWVRLSEGEQSNTSFLVCMATGEVFKIEVSQEH